MSDDALMVDLRSLARTLARDGIVLFARSVDVHGQSRVIGIDLLVGPVPPESIARVRIKEPRISRA